MATEIRVPPRRSVSRSDRRAVVQKGRRGWPRRAAGPSSKHDKVTSRWRAVGRCDAAIAARRDTVGVGALLARSTRRPRRKPGDGKLVRHTAGGAEDIDRPPDRRRRSSPAARPEPPRAKSRAPSRPRHGKRPPLGTALRAKSSPRNLLPESCRTARTVASQGRRAAARPPPLRWCRSPPGGWSGSARSGPARCPARPRMQAREERVRIRASVDDRPGASRKPEQRAMADDLQQVT